MKTFLSDERRSRLIELLGAIENMPLNLAVDLASAPDDLSVVDDRLTGHAHRAAQAREQINAGDQARITFMMINVVILCFYLQEIGDRGLGEDDLPLLHATFNEYNIKWGGEGKGKLN